MSTTIADLQRQLDLSASEISTLKADLARSMEVRAELTNFANDLAKQLQEAIELHEVTNAAHDQLGRELEAVKEDRLRMMADRNELETDRDKLFQEIYLFVVNSLEIANRRFRDPPPETSSSAPSSALPF